MTGDALGGAGEHRLCLRVIDEVGNGEGGDIGATLLESRLHEARFFLSEDDREALARGREGGVEGRAFDRLGWPGSPITAGQTECQGGQSRGQRETTGEGAVIMGESAVSTFRPQRSRCGCDTL